MGPNDLNVKVINVCLFLYLYQEQKSGYVNSIFPNLIFLIKFYL